MIIANPVQNSTKKGKIRAAAARIVIELYMA